MSVYSVLVLEDESHNRETLLQLIAGRKDLDLIFSAKDASQALQFLEGARPDIAFLDIHVPLGSGIQVAEKVVALRSIVVFTTAISGYALKAFQLGAADYLVKPFDGNQFARAVDRAIALLKRTPHDNSEKETGSTLTSVLTDRYKLTLTEVNVALEIAAGCPKELLEERAGKTKRTIKSHLQSIYNKTINTAPQGKNEGRRDKYGRLVYFLLALQQRLR